MEPSVLPDFPRIKSKWSSALLKMVREWVSQGAFVAEIKTTKDFEGDRLTTTDVAGTTEESTYQDLSAALEVNLEDLIHRGPIALTEALRKMGEELRSQQSKLIFERLNEITARTGNVVDAGGQDINHDLILKALGGMEIHFKENGEPQLPSLVVSPSQYERLKEKMPKWEQDERYNRKFDELINRKRREWLDRESHRKLVD